MRILARIMGEADALERGAGFALGFASRQRFEAEGDIVEKAEMGEQCEVLKHQPDAALLRWHEIVGPGNLLAIKEDAPRPWAFDARGNPKQGRFAATRRPEQAEHLRGGNVEADAVERQHLVITA